MVPEHDTLSGHAPCRVDHAVTGVGPVWTGVDSSYTVSLMKSLDEGESQVLSVRMPTDLWRKVYRFSTETGQSTSDSARKLVRLGAFVLGSHDVEPMPADDDTREFWGHIIGNGSATKYDGIPCNCGTFFDEACELGVTQLDWDHPVARTWLRTVSYRHK